MTFVSSACYFHRIFEALNVHVFLQLEVIKVGHKSVPWQVCKKKKKTYTQQLNVVCVSSGIYTWGIFTGGEVHTLSLLVMEIRTLKDSFL